MSKLLPFRSPIPSREHREPRLVEIHDDAADEVFEALSSKTARTIFSTLHDEPATSSDLADAAGTSLQNVRYHLDKLADAGLVEVVETWYSEQGREMKVYAPTNSSLVVMSGEGPPEATLRNLLKTLIGGIGVLAIISLLFDRTVALLSRKRGGGGAVVEPTPRVKTVILNRTETNETGTTPTPHETVSPVSPKPTPAAGMEDGVIIDILGMGVSPGIIFFIGGLFILLLALIWHYHRMPNFTW
jgi:DNA-binding transcriptional ArsR family regulator